MVLFHARSLHTATALATLTVAANCILLSGCSRPRAESDPPAVQVDDATDSNIVMITHPEQFPLSVAEGRESHSELQAPGVVAADVSRTVPVLSLAGGRVVEVRARL